MTMKNRRFDFRTAYIDLLINLLTGTVVLFILTTLLIAPITKSSEGIKKNADYVITLEWSTDIDCDLDIWVRDPQNNVVSYKTTESGLMYLERDDMGRRRSIYQINGKEAIIDPDNKEFVTLRGTFSGEYIVNVHVYSCLDPNTRLSKLPNDLVDVPFIIELVKINPTFYVYRRIEMKMDSVWQEKTAIRFTLNSNKIVTDVREEFVSIRSDNRYDGKIP